MVDEWNETPPRPALRILRWTPLYCAECHDQLTFEIQEQRNLVKVTHSENVTCSQSGREAVHFVTKVFEEIAI